MAHPPADRVQRRYGSSLSTVKCPNVDTPLARAARVLEQRVGADPIGSGMQQHFVSYPHLGEVPCFVADLEPLARPDLAAAPVLAA